MAVGGATGGIRNGDCFQEAACVVGPRGCEYLGDGAGFDDGARAEDHDAVGDLVDHREVVADEQAGETVFDAQVVSASPSSARVHDFASSGAGSSVSCGYRTSDSSTRPMSAGTVPLLVSGLAGMISVGQPTFHAVSV
ncbi:hypothetical protein [Nocardia sp. CA-135398]|uniref:hypothetical protein n=1 Tax=Nocardia sp. CA-135398 TaxID=3239977 RepID=UPI003D955F90